MKLESKFQSEVIRDLKKKFNGMIVLKLDPSYIQGIPDLLLLYNNMWATLEVKKTMSASFRPNQEYYISLMNKMSFSRMICPENKKQVFKELMHFFNVHNKKKNVA